MGFPTFPHFVVSSKSFTFCPFEHDVLLDCWCFPWLEIQNSKSKRTLLKAAEALLFSMFESVHSAIPAIAKTLEPSVGLIKRIARRDVRVPNGRQQIHLFRKVLCVVQTTPALTTFESLPHDVIRKAAWHPSDGILSRATCCLGPWLEVPRGIFPVNNLPHIPATLQTIPSHENQP